MLVGQRINKQFILAFKRFWVREKIKALGSQLFSANVSKGLHVNPPKISSNWLITKTRTGKCLLICS